MKAIELPAYGVIDEHCGRTPVDSRSGRGTAFQVHLPATGTTVTIDPSANEEALEAGRPADSPKRAGPACGDSRTILLVEDEEDLRELLGYVLDQDGYDVFEAPNALRALEIWRDKQGEIDVVLSDLLMPGGLNGCDMAEQMLAERPDLKMIFMSGYSRFSSDSDFLARNQIAFLQKPFLPHQVLEAVRRLFDS